MNIYASRGSKVSFLNKNGYDRDLTYANEAGLKEGEVYTVLETEVGSWSSSVSLLEFPGKSFNTVMFDDAIMCAGVNINTRKYKLDSLISQLEDSLANFSDDISLTKIKFQELDSIKELVNNFKKEI